MLYLIQHFSFFYMLVWSHFSVLSFIFLTFYNLHCYHIVWGIKALKSCYCSFNSRSGSVVPVDTGRNFQLTTYNYPHTFCAFFIRIQQRFFHVLHNFPLLCCILLCYLYALCFSLFSSAYG